MTVPKVILVFLGSLGEIGGPVKSLKFENSCDLPETGAGTLLNDSILFACGIARIMQYKPTHDYR